MAADDRPEAPLGFPVRISVRAEFSSGTVHEYEVDNVAAQSRAGVRHDGPARGLTPAPAPGLELSASEEEIIVAIRCRDGMRDGTISDLFLQWARGECAIEWRKG